MRSVLGVDLGSSWHSMGSAVLSFNDTRWTSCTLGVIAWPATICEPTAIADAILAFALNNNMDGPQGWR